MPNNNTTSPAPPLTLSQLTNRLNALHRVIRRMDADIVDPFLTEAERQQTRIAVEHRYVERDQLTREINALTGRLLPHSSDNDTNLQALRDELHNARQSYDAFRNRASTREFNDTELVQFNNERHSRERNIYNLEQHIDQNRGMTPPAYPEQVAIRAPLDISTSQIQDILNRNRSQRLSDSVDYDLNDEAPIRSSNYPTTLVAFSHQKCELQIRVSSKSIQIVIATRRHSYAKTIVSLLTSLHGLVMRREMYSDVASITTRHAQPTHGLQLALYDNHTTKIREIKGDETNDK